MARQVIFAGAKDHRKVNRPTKTLDGAPSTLENENAAAEWTVDPCEVSDADESGCDKGPSPAENVAPPALSAKKACQIAASKRRRLPGVMVSGGQAEAASRSIIGVTGKRKVCSAFSNAPRSMPQDSAGSGAGVGREVVRVIARSRSYHGQLGGDALGTNGVPARQRRV